MRSVFLLYFFLLMVISTWAQPTVSFHQSNLPFLGINYEIKNRLIPEFRLGVDNLLEEVGLELVVNVKLLRKENYDLYAGLGVRPNIFTGLVLPVGLNMYPFNTKDVGFHVELTPIFGEEDILRASWGIRYRFLRQTE